MSLDQLRETPGGLAADLHQAAGRLRQVGPSPLAAATADLLEAIAADMDDAAAYPKTVFAGTPMAHVQVFDGAGMRMDWTAARQLARVVLDPNGEDPC